MLAFVALATAAFYLLRERPSAAPEQEVFSGFRGFAEGAEYIEDDPTTGTTLIVRAADIVMRDGKIGRLFRSPLRPEVILSRVEASVVDKDGAVLFSARGPTGEYVPKGASVSLVDPDLITVGDRSVRTTKVLVRADGTVHIPGNYEVYRGASLLIRGKRYRGQAALIGEANKDRRPLEK